MDIMHINNEILYGFVFCQHKAFLKSKRQKGIISEYQTLYNQLKQKQKCHFEQNLSENGIQIFTDSTFDNIVQKEGVSLDLTFKVSNLKLIFDGIEFTGTSNIIPIFIIPLEKVTKYDRQFILLQSYYIQKECNIKIEYVKVIYGKYLNKRKLKLSVPTPSIKKLIGTLNAIAIDSVEPSLILNNHCVVCEYRTYCMDKAKADDNLSLLDRATDKIIEKYKKKGIFTVQQLSYLYRPRRRRKQKSKPIVSHNIEIQALAIRTDKTLVQLLPELSRQPIEIFLDVEGNPDKDTYYLIGLYVIDNQKIATYSFWANNASDDVHIWQQFLLKISEYPNSPIFHYGNYDAKAIEMLGKRYKTNTAAIQSNLINISNSIFGKIYFPVYSNRLKVLGNYIGATWSSNIASGIQSLVWRHLWEVTHDEKFKQLLITYNLEDCQALKLLTDKLLRIQESADILSDIDFVNSPKKNASLAGSQIHQQLDMVLKFAHETYDKSKICFQGFRQDEVLEKNKVGRKIGHVGTSRIFPKPKKKIIVPMKSVCPIHKCKLTESPVMSNQTITDLVFTKSGMRKSIIKYEGHKSYCSLCKKKFTPPQIEKIKNLHFGRNFKAWVVYQRLFLRLPYDVIRLNLIELFNEKISNASIYNIIKIFSYTYNITENLNLKQLLKSPFIHVDETQISFKGTNHYIWIFTDGKYVVFRETETREISMVVELLTDFKGILVSDFYLGYDSLNCMQQKCWVHLLRDLNDDLWKNPYDDEYEKFMLKLKDLIIPIFATIEKYGLKKCHFNKFRKNIDEFYELVILNKSYNSEITLKYQIRLKKHWSNLFTFLNFDNIPWNNNMAERGIRHIAIQRKISMYFSTGISHYLLFLGIMQSCKFQNKSFLKFLISGKKNI
ncbi:MAG: TM0106 family RecB-like putative nuclease [Bacteroidales bacterium]|jgi:predicted RecB family nuclease|nr:TM0106 family RecB-like putative nuclease [Bacteroidales bacterium]